MRKYLFGGAAMIVAGLVFGQFYVAHKMKVHAEAQCRERGGELVMKRDNKALECIHPGDAGAATEAKAPEAKPAEEKPAEAKAAEAPADTKAADTKSADTKAADTKPAKPKATAGK